MLFRPSESSKRIADFYRRYLLTTFGTNNEKYNEQLKKALEEKKAIADGPYISMSDPYEKGKSLRELAGEGVVSREILKIENFHPDRKLYRHQEEAIRKAGQGKNLIVTTGTGSGKTESFLIPVIDRLLREKEAGTLDAGVRTLIIYPMNALVNDQIRRLRELLSDTNGENGITFGRFTGETKETYKDALNKYQEIEGLQAVPGSNELISREQMRQTPPNILITNYAMLEYMLLRPDDNIIFSGKNAEKWQYIVFDEAHSYGGTKGIEVAELVKRVKGMLGRQDIRFILTSATLGDERSDREIIQFGENLCSAGFDASSIIRSHTVEVKPDSDRDIIRLDFELYRKLAEKIRNNYADDEIKKVIREFEPHINIDKEVNEILFDLILHDRFYYDVRNVLYQQIKTVDAVAGELNLSVNDFTDFIAVASNAVRDHERLFEAKYHMFLRGIEGVFVTLFPSERLFINKKLVYKENPADESDIGYRVYEISFCNNCGALFVSGEIEEGYLIQKSKSHEDYHPDIFLISGSFEEEEDSADTDETYQICAKCGAIKRASSVNGLQCGHGKENISKLIRVKESGEALHKCPCCHSVNGKRSILRPYYLGSEAATAVIATALYKELPGVEHKITIEEIDDEFFGGTGTQEHDEQTRLTKQFLAFSDSRQTAAFFATYLENTYRDTLVKRMMDKIQKEILTGSENGISLENFARYLLDDFFQYKIFPDKKEDELKTEAWIYIMKEISNFKARNSMMKEGILMFDIDLDFPAPKNLNLSGEEMTTMVKVLCQSLMKDSAVSTKVALTKADAERYAVAGFRRVYQLKGTGKTTIEGWAPEVGKTNKRLKYVTKVLEGDENTARKLLEAVWNQLDKINVIENAKFDTLSGYVIDHRHVRVKAVDKLYICTECRGITPYNVKGICDNPRCNGHLEEYDYKTARRNDHYYRRYSDTEDITAMTVKEHTAQLSSETAYEYQKEFKDKKINVLSCSTTFEMGVDVGSLETVLMRNMPPSPANYAQRAGRAGRSLQSAAYAVTFCPNSSHDLNYYKNPKAMIEGKIKPPAFNVSNEKIVLRHIFACAFSHFWKIYPDFYKKTVGEFMDVDGFGKMKEFLEQKPDALLQYLKGVVPVNLQKSFDIENFGWVEKLFHDSGEDAGLCNIVVDKYREDLENLNQEKEKCIQENKIGVDSITRSIKTIRDQRMIDFLSRNSLIPKYGFPVDTVELQCASYEGNANLRLSRDLSSAISEYAPGSQVVADGQLITSRYVRKLPGYEWPKYNYAVCPTCLTLNKQSYVRDIKNCRQCGEDLPGRARQYIIPKFGFWMDPKATKPVGSNKPERTYKGAISYIGDEQKIDFYEYKIENRRLLLGNSKMDSLAVLNESPFYICPSCGYGEVFEREYSVECECKHKTPSGYTCGNTKLHRYTLGHEFQTDVVLIKFVDFDISDKDEAWTILYSLLEGLSRNMSIDRNELSGCLQWYKDLEHSHGNFGFVLFDNTPGGAGYVRQLQDPKVLEEMLREAFRTVAVCSCGEETTCYGCLRNYYNQKQHDIMKRRYAIEFFEQFSPDYDREWSCGKSEELYAEQYRETESEAAATEEADVVPGKEHFQLEFCNKGRNQKGDSAEEIWSDLLEDCEDEEEAAIIKSIRNSDCSNMSKPVYSEYVRIIETGEEFYVRQLWKEKKTMLFLKEDEEDYRIAQKTGWYCYSTTHQFDIEEFIKRIEG